VALMVALPLLFAPFRALIGFRSDTAPLGLGWRRVPYIWIGTLLQFGGLAIMPFALLLLTGDTTLGPAWVGQVGAGLAFLLVGAGAADHADRRPGAGHRPGPGRHAAARGGADVRDAAGGHGGQRRSSSGLLLADFSHTRLVQVVQGAAVVTVVLNVRGAVEAGSRATRSARGARRAGADLPPHWARLAAPAARAASCWRWAWARWPSTCRT
jgi:BCD family chlorophyll transporter-like MFS transporter